MEFFRLGVLLGDCMDSWKKTVLFYRVLFTFLNLNELVIRFVKQKDDYQLSPLGNQYNTTLLSSLKYSLATLRISSRVTFMYLSISVLIRLASP